MSKLKLRKITSPTSFYSYPREKIGPDFGLDFCDFEYSRIVRVYSVPNLVDFMPPFMRQKTNKKNMHK